MGTLSAHVTYPHVGNWFAGQALSLHNLPWRQPPSVLVLPVWKGQVAVQDVRGTLG